MAAALIRRSREGDLSIDRRDLVLERLRRDIDSMYVVELSAEVSGSAVELLTRHSLRSGDAIQLAARLHLAGRSGASIGFVAYDTRLREAATREGLTLAIRT